VCQKERFPRASRPPESHPPGIGTEARTAVAAQLRTNCLRETVAEILVSLGNETPLRQPLLGTPYMLSETVGQSSYGASGSTTNTRLRRRQMSRDRRRIPHHKIILSSPRAIGPNYLTSRDRSHMLNRIIKYIRKPQSSLTSAPSTDTVSCKMRDRFLAEKEP
jgi:hypothetical protein